MYKKDYKKRTRNYKIWNPNGSQITSISKCLSNLRHPTAVGPIAVGIRVGRHSKVHRLLLLWR